MYIRLIGLDPAGHSSSRLKKRSLLAGEHKQGPSRTGKRFGYQMHKSPKAISPCRGTLLDKQHFLIGWQRPKVIRNNAF